MQRTARRVAPFAVLATLSVATVLGVQPARTALVMPRYVPHGVTPAVAPSELPGVADALDAQAARTEFTAAFGVVADTAQRLADEEARAAAEVETQRAEAARLAAVEAARRAAPTPLPVAPSASVPTGSCYASALPAYIVNRESGGDPTIINGGGHAASPYVSGGRAWGCFQFMPATWAANCADLGFSAADQVTCANRVSRGGTNLAPWG